MTAPGHARDELMGLCHDLTESRLTRAQADRLEELLAADPANREVYVDFMLVVGGLHRIRGAGGAENDECRRLNDELAASTALFPAVPPIRHSSFIFHQFPGATLAYAVTLLLTALAVIGAWRWQGSRGAGAGRMAAGQFRMESPAGPLSAAPAGTVVAKVTQIGGGEWGDQLKVGTQVTLGARFAFTDGLVEITYDNGVQIILAGPAIFDADLPNGGYLLAGKLLARAQPRGRAGKASGGTGLARGATAGPPQTQPVTIRTPTTSMTGWSGSFGALVDRAGGGTYVRVFKGKVSLQSPHAEQTVSLADGFWAFTQIEADGRGTVIWDRGDPPPIVAHRLPDDLPLYSESGPAAPARRNRLLPEKAGQNSPGT